MDQLATTPPIQIHDESDGFTILIGTKRFHFDQEDTRERMVEVFAELGHLAVHHEVY